MEENVVEAITNNILGTGNLVEAAAQATGREAVQLVLQAGAMGKSGELFALDMGEPVKIMDLAHDLIRLSGLEEDVDVDIEFTGIRPGEKLYEELLFGDEDMRPTAHPKVLHTYLNGSDHTLLDRLDFVVKSALAADEQEDALRDLLHTLVPDFAHEDARTDPKTRHTPEPGSVALRPKVV